MSPQEIQAKCKEAFVAAIPGLAEIAKGGDEVKPSERIAAMKLLSEHAFPGPQEIILESGVWIAEMMRVTAHHLNDRERFIAWHEDIEKALEELRTS